MKTRNVVIAAFAVLLAGGGLAVLTHPTETPEEGVYVKAKPAKAAKTAAPADIKPKPDDGWVTGRITSFAFADTYVEQSEEEKAFATKIAEQK